MGPGVARIEKRTTPASSQAKSAALSVMLSKSRLETLPLQRQEDLLAR